MLWGILFIVAGIFIILSIFFSITLPVWLAIASLIVVAGIVSMVKSFPNGLGVTIFGALLGYNVISQNELSFGKFVIALLASGLIEIGLKLIISKIKRKNDWDTF